MAGLATPEFLSTLKSAFPPAAPNTLSYLWAMIAVVSFSASNIIEAVPLVFKYVLDDLIQAQTLAGTPQDAAHVEQLVLARKIREAILRAGLLCGMPRVSALLYLVHESGALRTTIEWPCVHGLVPCASILAPYPRRLTAR